MVINSNPALAYLMRDNSLCLQILTIAHVYGHNDFFKNNFTFKRTRAEFTIGTFKAHADRVRALHRRPVDRGRARSRPSSTPRTRSRSSAGATSRSRSSPTRRSATGCSPPPQPPPDPFQRIHRRSEYVEPGSPEAPARPEEDLLLFIRDHNPFLAELGAGPAHDRRTRRRSYFIPQIETKIMNEGWASCGAPRDPRTRSSSRRSSTSSSWSGTTRSCGRSPAVSTRTTSASSSGTTSSAACDEPTRGRDPRERSARRRAACDMLLETREADRDVSFLRRWLTEDLMRELDLFRVRAQGRGPRHQPTSPTRKAGAR